MNHIDQIIESIVKPIQDTDKPIIEKWFIDHKFAVTEMKTGFLISGPESLFEELFCCFNSPRGMWSLTALQIPSELHDKVEFFELVKPRQFHKE